MVLIKKPVCKMQRGLASSDRGSGWTWFCKVCGFNSIIAQGVESYTVKKPQCPCVEMKIGTSEPRNTSES